MRLQDRRELVAKLVGSDKRSDIATALLSHAEDADDPMIPLLIWYGIEPVVGAEEREGGLRASDVPAEEHRGAHHATAPCASSRNCA